MWVVGDWGQATPWSRDTGVQMVKGENDVYTGELSLPKGTKFDIKILKSTVSATSGGDNTWSAVRYASTLNTSTSYDFGEFIDNFINGNLDEERVGWTPDTVIKKNDMAHTPPNVIELSEGESVLSDVFTLPPNQPNICFVGYCTSVLGNSLVNVQLVSPQNDLLYTVGTVEPSSGVWKPFKKTFFKAFETPMKMRVKLVNNKPGATVLFDSMALVGL